MRPTGLHQAFTRFVISIHAPIVGCDISIEMCDTTKDDFNPRTHRGVRRSFILLNKYLKFISIHAPIVGCDRVMRDMVGVYIGISIHAPIVGCDLFEFPHEFTGDEISIHAPIVGCDLKIQRYI